MKQLTCEMCGSTDLMKSDGVFICQTCGCKYSIEEAKKMMVEGVVSVDKSQDAQKYLEIARIAKSALNHEKAELYAGKTIEIDPDNCEAWYIQGSSADWQSTVEDDRFPDSHTSFNKMLSVLANTPIEEISDEEVRLLADLKNHVEKITNSRCEMYTDQFRSMPSIKNCQLITKVFDAILNLSISLMNSIGVTAHKLIEKNSNQKNSGETIKPLNCSSTEEIDNEIRYAIGAMIRGIAVEIGNCSLASDQNWTNKWEKNNIFVYFDTEHYKNSKAKEKELFDTCGTAYQQIVNVCEYNRHLLETNTDLVNYYIERKQRVINFQNELLHGVTGANKHIQKTQSLDEIVAIQINNEIGIYEELRDRKTIRRLSGNRINYDGWMLTQAGKAEIDEKIALLHKELEQYDPVKKAEAKRKELEEDYWKAQPEEADSKKNNDEQIAKLTSEIKELKTDRAALGILIHRSKKAAIDQMISTKEEELEKFNSTNAEIEKRRQEWVDSKMAEEHNS